VVDGKFILAERLSISLPTHYNWEGGFFVVGCINAASEDNNQVNSVVIRSSYSSLPNQYKRLSFSRHSSKYIHYSSRDSRQASVGGQYRP
jgi:hypothetical protein